MTIANVQVPDNDNPGQFKTVMMLVPQTPAPQPPVQTTVIHSTFPAEPHDSENAQLISRVSTTPSNNVVVVNPPKRKGVMLILFCTAFIVLMVGVILMIVGRNKAVDCWNEESDSSNVNCENDASSIWIAGIIGIIVGGLLCCCSCCLAVGYALAH
eukprot:CAMPEP_0168560420 /NCGR_PEP_ID=MMETSP0413-20121227/11051_1 /TAXON_ID=136452 /ORGANISM="Filamoeba nolandi, Strain NC-AS-23-1" /LENGTH=155 /DNA_ID=CAMNT_0008591721 /DNA_START=113 /DNA_END=580 /DNA_ORIENTATION=-